MLVALTVVSPLVMFGLLMGLARVEHWLDGPGTGPAPPRVPVVLTLPTPRTPLDADLGLPPDRAAAPDRAAVAPDTAPGAPSRRVVLPPTAPAADAAPDVPASRG